VAVDVVVTVRDPARQVPAEYQEGVKHGRRMSYPKFLDTILSDEDPGGAKRGSTRRRFWNAQDPVAVLDRWAAHLGPERCHVVTCPPPGAEPTLLWSRMARVLGVEDVEVQMPPQEVNTSLGAVQIEVLRRLNRRVNRKGNEKVYGDVVKRLYAGTILRGQSGDKLRLPAAYADRVDAVASGWIDQLTQRGYPVSGDLADLVPARSGDDAETRKGAAKMLVSSLDATADLLREVERLREENAALRGESGGSRLRRRHPVKVGSGGRL
jgi:antitoxin (DNA-binding transcriptional repressor) of toxin-antitoxin stability system